MKTLLFLHLRVLSRGTDGHVISSSPCKVKFCHTLGKHSKNWKPDIRFLENSLKCGAWGPEDGAGMPALWVLFLHEQVLYLLAFVSFLVYVFKIFLLVTVVLV